MQNGASNRTRPLHYLQVLVLIAWALTLATPAATFAAAPELSPEQQLVQRYAPQIILRTQANACDPNGEPYMPLPVDAVLNDPAVMLREKQGNQDASLDPIVKYGPGQADIAGKSKDFYLDFPGDPLNPTCYYEQWSRKKEKIYAPTTYARIATMEDELTAEEAQATPGIEDFDLPDGKPLLALNETVHPEGLVIQYWFFYIFNDFNNKHEGDWEMIQINFDVPTVEQALATKPYSITSAQHAGGERHEWDSDAVTLDGTNPRVFSARGSHATHFDAKLYIGWGKRGAGFGCDDTRAPGHTITPNVVLIPDDYATNPEFAWLTFAGRWGEKKTWEFNGPRGPVYSAKWQRPVTWVDTVRERSLYIPEITSLGPTPGKVFCQMASAGSQILIYVNQHPWGATGLLAAAIGTSLLLYRTIHLSLTRAARVYFRYRRSISTIAVALVPLGFLVTMLQQVLTAVPPVSWVVALIGTSEVARLATALAAGGLLALLEVTVFAPAIIITMEHIRRNQPTDAAVAWRSVRNRFPTIFRAWFSITIRVFLLSVTIVGLPWAFRQIVRWTFFAQAIMIDDVSEPGEVRQRSSDAVDGHWLPVMAHSVVLSLITILPGPLIGIALLILFSPGIELVNVLSSVVYAFVVPYKTIALTLLYYRYTNRTDEFLSAFARPDSGRPQVAERLAPAGGSDL